MSLEMVDTPNKKAAVDAGRLETEDMPSVTPRKRKARKTADREAPAHEAGAQGRRSDLVPTQSTATERQRQRHPQASLAHRRMSLDIHRPRRSNVSDPALRPVRTKRAASIPPGPPRTMLQHAWHTVLNSDPLLDSDEECPDEHLRLDYNRRIHVIARLRGRPPTPETECSQTVQTA